MNQRSEILRRKRARRTQSGAIYIESLLVISVLVVIFSATVYLSAAFKAKLESFDKATSVAMKNAAGGCGPPLGGSYNIAALIGKGATSLTSPSPTYLGGATQAAQGQASLPVGSSSLYGVPTRNFGAQAQLLCNELPISKDAAWTALGAKDWLVNGVLGAAGF